MSTPPKGVHSHVTQVGPSAEQRRCRRQWIPSPGAVIVRSRPGGAARMPCSTIRCTCLLCRPAQDRHRDIRVDRHRPKPSTPQRVQNRNTGRTQSPACPYPRLPTNSTFGSTQQRPGNVEFPSATRPTYRLAVGVQNPVRANRPQQQRGRGVPQQGGHQTGNPSVTGRRADSAPPRCARSAGTRPRAKQPPLSPESARGAQPPPPGAAEHTRVLLPQLLSLADSRPLCPTRGITAHANRHTTRRNPRPRRVKPTRMDRAPPHPEPIAEQSPATPAPGAQTVSSAWGDYSRSSSSSDARRR